MRKAFDTILFDYVDADDAAKSGGFEPYRFECACCWEEVRLCAADSKSQATHYRHRSGNNNVKCENYLGSRSTVISNALYRKNARDKIDFYFSNETKMFSVGVKFNATEIEEHEKNEASFQIRKASTSKPTISIPIKKSRFLPDVSELIPIDEFSWEYYVSSSTDSKRWRHELFRRGEQYSLLPSFFKIHMNDDDDNFRAKLVRSETLYTNTPYLIVFTHQNYTIAFREDSQMGKEITFRTMGREFSAVTVTFTNKTQKVEQQLKAWKYNIEVNETLTVLWPPSSQVDDTMRVKTKCAYIFSSFSMQPHGNINVHSEDIVRLGEGISKISINGRTKIHKKNTELLLSCFEDDIREFDDVLLEQETAKEYKATDDASYLFDHSGVSPMSKGMVATLTAASEVRHYSFGYLDRIVKLANVSLNKSGEQILCEILMYYKKDEELIWDDMESVDLSATALDYIEACKKAGRINSAAKRFIKEGHI